MKNRSFQLFAIMIFAVIVLCFIFGIMNISNILRIVHGEGVKKDDIEVLGVFGDSAGLLNALFSSLAFGGVVLTIIWQVAENSKQRSDEHRIQFENVFFNMTNTFERIVTELKVKRETDNGGNASGQLDDTFDSDWGAGSTNNPSSDNYNTQGSEYVSGQEVFKYLYEERAVSMVTSIEHEGIKGFEKQMSGILDSYFRYLYRILKYIDDSKLINNDTKYQYAGILRARLSYMELLLIYYNGLSSYGSEKLKPLIEKYHLLKNIRKEKLHGQMLNAKIKYMDDKNLYNKSAWETELEPVNLKSQVGVYLWRLFGAIMFALIFNTLLDSVWYRHVICKWVGMGCSTIKGVDLFLFLMNVRLFRYLNCRYEKALSPLQKKRNILDNVWSLLKEEWIVPYFLFMLITSVYVNMEYHIVWYGYIDILLIYMPIIMVVMALIWNVIKVSEE